MHSTKKSQLDTRVEIRWKERGRERIEVGHEFSNLAQSTDCAKAAYMGAKPINIHTHGQNGGNECLCFLFPSYFEEESGIWIQMCVF